MAKFVKGDVVVVPFPFSDLTQAKRHPALILAELSRDNFFKSNMFPPSAVMIRHRTFSRATFNTLDFPLSLPCAPSFNSCDFVD